MFTLFFIIAPIYGLWKIYCVSRTLERSNARHTHYHSEFWDSLPFNPQMLLLGSADIKTRTIFYFDVGTNQHLDSGTLRGCVPGHS